MGFLQRIRLRLALRRCRFAHPSVEALGRLWVRGDGQVFLGPRVLLDGRMAPVELYALERGEIRVGADVRIGPGTSIEALERVEIGDGARIGALCKILDSNFHPVGANRFGDVASLPVMVGAGATVGARCILLPGCVVPPGARVRPGTVVAARSSSSSRPQSSRAPRPIRQGPRSRFGRMALAAWHVLAARVVLRSCRLGALVRARGFIRVRNQGAIRIGARSAFQAGGVPTELVAHRGAVLEIGERADFNHGVYIEAARSVRIGRRCMFGSHVYISDRAPGVMAPVVIEDDVWVAHSVVMHPGVTIGSGSVLAAGSVVVRDVPPNSLASGNPARCLSLRLRPEAGAVPPSRLSG